MTTIIPFSEACERNKQVILDIIEPYLREVVTVLEIGSGTAQHSMFFSSAITKVQWQTSDQLEYLDGINAALDNNIKINPENSNVLRPIPLDVNQSTWVEGGTQYQAVYTANTLHIMAESDVEQFFMGLHAVTQEGSYLIVYGPFKYNGEFTSASNRDFDESLRSRGVGSGIRDFETVVELAAAQGFKLIKDHSMPANNQCVIWQR